MGTALTRSASTLRGKCLKAVRTKTQDGINMVDLMMWLVIAALLLAAALQGIGYYQKATNVYVLKNDLSNAASVAHAQASLTSGTIDDAALNATLAQTKLSNGTVLKWGTMSVTAAAELKQPGSTDAPYGIERASVSTSVNGLVYVLSDTNPVYPGVEVYMLLERTAGHPEGITVAAAGSMAVTTGGSTAPAAAAAPSTTTPAASSSSSLPLSTGRTPPTYLSITGFATGNNPAKTATYFQLWNDPNIEFIWDHRVRAVWAVRDASGAMSNVYQEVTITRANGTVMQTATDGTANMVFVEVPYPSADPTFQSGSPTNLQVWDTDTNIWRTLTAPAGGTRPPSPYTSSGSAGSTMPPAPSSAAPAPGPAPAPAPGPSSSSTAVMGP